MATRCNLCACSFPPCATRARSRGRACPTLLGSAAMYTEGTASRPPTATGLADIEVQENEICTRVVAEGPRCGPFALLRAGSAAFPAVRVLAALQTRENPSPHGPRRQNHGAVEEPPR